MLRRIGFSYAERIDPFDGGPHFIAKTDDITLVRRALELQAEIDPSQPQEASPAWLAAHDTPSAPYFVARACGRPAADSLRLTQLDADRLGVGPGDRVWALPLS